MTAQLSFQRSSWGGVWARFLRGAQQPTTQALIMSALGLGGGVLGCSRKPPPGAMATNAEQGQAASSAAVASASGSNGLSAPMATMLQALEDAGAEADGGPGTSSIKEEPKIGAMAAQVPIYAGPLASRETRMGYLRRGAKVAVDPHAIEGGGTQCADGWYKLIPIGYVCGKFATLDLRSPQVRLGVVAPNLGDILPYRYAFNVSHGTPLYRSVPSRDEMAEYEPYLEIKFNRYKDKLEHEKTAASTTSKPKRRRKHTKHDSVSSRQDDDHDEMPTPGVPTPTPAAPEATGGAMLPSLPPVQQGATGFGASPPNDALAADAGADLMADAGPPKAWWQQSLEPGKNPEIKLSDLTEDADGVLVKRMVRGFYVAIDRTFSMNGRPWYRTTTGLVAPADRLGIVKPTELKGQEMDEEHASNAVGFVLAQQSAKYELDPNTKGSLKIVGPLVRYDRAFLTGKTATISAKVYRETIEGWWMRGGDITYSDPGAPPPDLAPGEKWIDINLARQTLVAFEGTRPVFATLLSSGRKGEDKAHDHTTPQGTWRIREKHITATMDGDGAVSGDLPYSIEDVPYIQYFFESYALHGAFWHDSFGRQKSHGCINLSPLDAKRLFFWSDPPIPIGWHGVFSSAQMPGSRVVVHD